MSKMIEVKTVGLMPPALDWSMAEAGNLAVKLVRGGRYGEPESLWFVASMLGGWKYSPSTDWAQCGPLIEKYRIDLTFEWTDHVFASVCDSEGNQIVAGAYGPTQLVAACRAIVAAKLGDTVQVPAELLEVSA